MKKLLLLIPLLVITVFVTGISTVNAIQQEENEIEYVDDRFDGEWKLRANGYLANADEEKLQKVKFNAIWIIDGDNAILEDIEFKTKVLRNYELVDFTTIQLRNPGYDFQLTMTFENENHDVLIVDLDFDDLMDHFVEDKNIGVMFVEGEITGNDIYKYDITMYGIAEPPSD